MRGNRTQKLRSEKLKAKLGNGRVDFLFQLRITFRRDSFASQRCIIELEPNALISNFGRSCIGRTYQGEIEICNLPASFAGSSQNSGICQVSAEIVGWIKTFHRVRYHSLNVICGDSLSQFFGDANERIKISGKQNFVSLCVRPTAENCCRFRTGAVQNIEGRGQPRLLSTPGTPDDQGGISVRQRFRWDWVRHAEL